MKTSDIIHALKNLDCDACEHDPICRHGNMCVIVQEACERLALLEKEKEACFRLGQMDAIENFVDMLDDKALYVAGGILVPVKNLAEFLDPFGVEVCLTHD